MIWEPIERQAGAYQQALSEDEVTAIAQRAFGNEYTLASAIELGDGTYNTTYRLTLDTGLESILRVAPEPARQFRSERAFMRNEHAAAPYFAPVAALMPRTIAVDFTHTLIGRDYMVQSVVPGVPARIGLEKYPRVEWAWFFRDLGMITRRIHAVRGTAFGPAAGPGFDSWGTAVHACFADLVADIEHAGLDADDVCEAAASAAERRDVLDEIREPRLLQPDEPHPTVSGFFDCDRATWGDPESDWAIYRAAGRPGTERDAFWEAYGPLDPGPRAVWRRALYQVRNIAAARLENHRLAQAEGIAASYRDMRGALDRLKEAESAC